jgi:hypothetical protein
MIRDPALRFCVDYVEAEGGLCEHDAETAQLILPAGLQRALGLPEVFTATTDPDVAQDEGAVLLTIGHPALDAAAASVIERGDVGRAYLARPQSARPGRETLLAHARARIAVEHGRIDAPRDPVPTYYPALRVGVLVRYTLDDHFQECEETWVDGRSGLPLASDVVRSLRSQAMLAGPEDPAPLVAAEIRRAVTAAHAALEDRAKLRAAALERSARLSLGDEQDRAARYYDAVLATLDERRAAASPERLALLDAQVEATHLERRRRLHEIARKFEAVRSIAPYRLHLLYVPALAFEVEVRRGERRYPLDLHWLLSAACFAPLRCAACDAAEPLAAGRTHLGCRRCLARG